MKLLLTFILIFSSTIAQANNNYSKSYIKMLLVENARKSSYVTPALALAIAEVESSFRSNAVSSKGAIGVMQIMPRTALLEFGVPEKDLFNPIINIKIGVQFLDSLIKKYRGDIGIALSHYNGGSAVGRWPNVKIIPATYPYVLKVLKNSNKLGMQTPTLFKIKNTRIDKVIYTPKLNKNFSEIDISVNNIDKWLNVYNSYKKGTAKLHKFDKKNKSFLFQSSGTNTQAFF